MPTIDLGTERACPESTGFGGKSAASHIKLMQPFHGVNGEMVERWRNVVRLQFRQRWQSVAVIEPHVRRCDDPEQWRYADVPGRFVPDANIFIAW